jgi:hypothetical protein
MHRRLQRNTWADPAWICGALLACGWLSALAYEAGWQSGWDDTRQSAAAAYQAGIAAGRAACAQERAR